ncbi:hypothetical protein AB835_06320 [Candidatus Endobugula sertula]|uniref:DNA polymerase III subunit chi n=1 Tax=Candidatus Endobugula sertula TaxID=62101 RepID=A0A1D2QQS3_9GAMM|nr:hypothetical protein AB835_06320 [Candidatus Endobugula sertula]
MTEIDFYILPNDSLAARDHFACRLAEKAIRMGKEVLIQVNDQQHGESLSDYLWSYKPESFLPHLVWGKGKQEGHLSTKVIIDWLEPHERFHDVMINLKHEIPTTFSRFQKLSEIVVQESELLPITRSHFQFYRDRGYPLKAHKVR